MRKKILLFGGVLVGIVIVMLIGGAVVTHLAEPQNGAESAAQSSNPDGAPMVTANIVDVDKIAAITKFRSCQGHIVVPQDGSETRSNMKHYFYIKKAYTVTQGQVPLYAPFDGYVSDIFGGDEGFEDRVASSRDVSFSTKKGIASRSAWLVTILHIVPLETLKEGARVKAGELVGHVALEKIPPYYSFDVTYSKMGTIPKQVDGWRSPYKALDSIFAHMNASVLAQYQQFKATTPTDFAISKSVRDASPCQYQPGSVQFSRELNKDWNNDWLGNITDAI